MLKFEKYNSGPFTRGRIICTNVGSIGNALRRILLDELEMVALNANNPIVRHVGPTFNYEALDKIGRVRAYEEGEFYIKVNNNSSERIVITSNMIFNMETKKPAKVQQDVELFYLAPKCKITLKNIVSVRGIGRQHAKFSGVIGPVTYLPTDVNHVYYLNERGFLENNRRMIPVDKSIDRNKNYYIRSKESVNIDINKRDQSYIDTMTELKIKDPKFLQTEMFDSQDFIITFYSEDVEVTYKAAVAELIRQMSNDTFDDIYTMNVAEIMRQRIYALVPCEIYLDKTEIDNRIKLTINHDDKEKLIKRVREDVIKILN